MAKKPTRRKPIKKSGGRRATGSRSAAGEASGAQAGAASEGDGQTIEGRADEPKKKRINPFEFGQQVLSEGSKVTWTARNEMVISTIMVLIMVALMAAFFFIVDSSLRFAVCNFLPIECVARNAL
ncbi:MAG: preprotein translocase subunit SecE [Pseudomonadota bacterium]